MTENNGFYPVMPIRRHEDNCKACLEPQFCDCLCGTCKKSREDYYCSQDYNKYLSDIYNKYLSGITDPRDQEN